MTLLSVLNVSSEYDGNVQFRKNGGDVKCDGQGNG